MGGMVDQAKTVERRIMHCCMAAAPLLLVLLHSR